VSDPIKHECGLALVRLRKPLDHYLRTYGTALWGLNKVSLLLEKQHNRGQDGAGLACLKLDVPPGYPYLARERVIEPAPPWQSLLKVIGKQLQDVRQREPDITRDPQRLKQEFDFAGELYLGHLRYGTHGNYSIEYCHPVIRHNNWRARTLLCAGNFNLTNADDQFNKLIELGQHPRMFSDTVTILERIGHFLDDANQDLFDIHKKKGLANADISLAIGRDLDILGLLKRSAKYWDGGYTIGGLIGHGDAFVCRDPWGIRPCFYYANEDVVAVASERPALATTFNVTMDDIKELAPGHALVIKADGRFTVGAFIEAQTQQSCSFERIYFSRGSDRDIYTERKALGRLMAPNILASVDNDLNNTVFSYIPNTSQVAFWGLLKALEDVHNLYKTRRIQSLPTPLDAQVLTGILSERVRVEYVILKDTNLRTFITDDTHRDDMVGHVYDITYGTIRPGLDNLVCLDDSIVRGTTLRQSILRILARLQPKSIVIASSAPQIRYPDCYGIDMSQLGRFIAFQAAIDLLKETGQGHVIDLVYQLCRQADVDGTITADNYVKRIYAPFTEQQIADRAALLLTPPDLGIPVKIVYQPLANLRQAIPRHTGDWYFSGNYPTPGGNKVVNQAFINYYEGRDHRAY